MRNQMFSAIVKNPKATFLLEAILNLQTKAFEYILRYVLMQMCAP